MTPEATACPILQDIRQVALQHLRKRDKPALEAIDLQGTRNETLELRRARIFLAAFYPGATVEAHPGGALLALKVAAVPFIGKPSAMPRTSAARRQFFIAVITNARAAP